MTGNTGRERWSSTLGFILASIGSAVGIGNVWRFPYIVGANGGGAFLIPYLISVLLFGLPLMVLEFAIGRNTGTSVVTAFRSIQGRFSFAGLAVVAMSGRIPMNTDSFSTFSENFGVACFLGKPFTVDQVLEAIDRALASLAPVLA